MGELDFAGRVALVTSAATGLGLHYVNALASAGAIVVLADSENEPGKLAVERCRARSWDAHFEYYTKPVEEEFRTLIERIVARFGKLDILVTSGPTASVHPQTSDGLRAVLEAQVCPADAAMRAALPVMYRQGYGRVVNCASGVGAFAVGANASFRAATAALFALTTAAALDYLDADVRINAVAPLVATSLSDADFCNVPLLDSAVFDAGEIAPLVGFLAHAECRVTGHTLTAGGGRHASIWMSSAPGFFMPGASSRDIAENWSTIAGRENAVAPVTPLDEMAMVVV